MTLPLLSVWAAGVLPRDPKKFVPGAISRFTISYDTNVGFSVRDASGAQVDWNDEKPETVGDHREREWSLTLVGVSHTQFHKDGWPDGGVPDIAFRSIADVPPNNRMERHCLPFAHDLGDVQRAYVRLVQICALGCSVVRLTRLDVKKKDGAPPWEPAGQWLSFRLTLLDSRLFEAHPGSRTLSPSRVMDAAKAGLDGFNPEKNFSFIEDRRAAAGLRDVLAHRTPYIAGGFRHHGSVDRAFESFASNAASIQVLEVAPSPFTGTMIPSRKDRSSRVAALNDGFWWASPADGLDQAKLTLTEAISRLACFPVDPSGGSARPILSLLESPTEARAAQLAILDVLSLQAAAVAPPNPSDLPGCRGANTVPYHYLHVRNDGGTLEWRRWLALAADPSTLREPGETQSPALLRVRRTAGEPKHASALKISIEGLTDYHFSHIWAHKVGRSIRNSARHEGDIGNLTLVPEFVGSTSEADKKQGGLWCAEFECDEPWPDADAPPDLFLGRYFLKSVSLKRMTERAAPKTAGLLNVLDTPEPKAAVGKWTFGGTQLRFPDLQTQVDSEERALTFDGNLRIELNPGPTNELKFEIDSNLDWRLLTEHTVSLEGEKITPHADSASLVAIGGLDIKFDTDSLARFELAVEVNEAGVDYQLGRDDPLLLRVLSVTVGGVDLHHGLAAQPLLWANALMERGWLEGRDYRSRMDAKRTMTFDLEPDAKQGVDVVGRSEVTIIDPSPMLVVKVSAEKLSAPSGIRSSAASWQSAEGFWRLTPATDKKQVIELTLPPQGVAEAWERSSTTPHTDQVGEGTRVPARLVPASELYLEGDERARNQIAPWNMRDIFGFSDADLPGARLLKVGRLEVLYGLEAWTGELVGFRLAEMAGWRGTPREPITRDTARRATWVSALAAWSGRLAVLDLRDERDLSARPRIESVRFRLRTKSDYELNPASAPSLHSSPSPSKGITGDGAKYVKPDGSSLDAELSPEEQEFWTEAKNGGLLGGAFTGFEQPSIIQTLHRRRDGIGELDGLQVSALGAWTRPRAAFQNGLTLIACDAAMGRIHEARFERKGRIGALHHLAKHVIVYRRTFVPSRQFGSEQDPNIGRPIIRKVEEFVEITLPVRSYPDRVGANELNSGPLLGARFRTVRIPVHGSWASPLRDPRVEGYSIPLWREGEDPAVYPRPVIELILAGDPDRTEPEPLARRIENPERLRFYTVTQVGVNEPSGDVEGWPLVYGVDYVHRAFDNPIHDERLKEKFQVPDQPAAMLPPEALEAPGLEGFTLRLEAGPGVNVTQGRATKPTIADLRSILMMRAVAPKTPPADATPLRNVIAAKAQGNALAEVARAPAGSVDELKTEAIKNLEDLKDLLPEMPPSEASLCGWAQAPAAKFATLKGRLELVDQLEGLWTSNQTQALGSLRLFEAEIDALLPLDQSMARIFAPVIERADRASHELVADVRNRLQSANGAIGLELRGWRAALAEMKTAIETAGSEVDKGHTNAQVALAWMHSELSGRARDAQAALTKLAVILPKLDEAAATLREAAPKIEKTLPKACGLALTFAAQLEAIRARLEKIQARGRTTLPVLLALVQTKTAEWARESGATADNLKDMLAHASAEVDALDGGLAEWADLEKFIVAAPDALHDQFKSEIAYVRKEFTNLGFDSSPLAMIEEGLRALSAAVAELRRYAGKDLPSDLIKRLKDAKEAITDPMTPVIGALQEKGAKFCIFLSQIDNLANQIVLEGRAKLESMIDDLEAIKDIAELRTRIEGYAQGIGTALERLRDGIEEALDGTIMENLTNQAVAPDTFGEAVALNLLRAAGAPPTVEHLLFNRDQIAYHFEAEARRVIITPVTALVDQVDQALRGVGVALPTLGLEETLLAPAHRLFDDLRNGTDGVLDGISFKAKDVLKDFAGLKDLLPNLDFGSELASAIKVTHDYDAKRNVAWLQADILYGPKDADLFRHDAFAVVAERMVLSGVSRYERGLGGGESRSVKASLVSNWVLIIGGMPLARIRDAAIRYDDKSGMKFDIDPEKIEFPGALQLLTKVLEGLNLGGEKPLVIELLNDTATGRPIGLKSRYDMPPTSFGIGIFSVMNAAMGVHLDLAQRSEFEIRSFAYFGRKDSPFAMTVSFLGGGGYMEAEAVHLPASRRTDIALHVSIGLAAGTGFAFGPLKGSIQVYLGFEASFYSGSAGSRIRVTALFVLSGSVTAWGFVTVTLGVRLAITYDGSAMRGNGSVQVEVRISRFFKKRFSRAITYRL